MWSIGHISMGYIFSRAGFGKQPIKPRTLLLIFFIAFIPDFIHIYYLRTMSHSLVFFIPFILIILWVFYKLNIVHKNEIIPLVIVGFAHIIGDLLFGSFELLYPYSYQSFGVLAWGSYLDMSIEICLFCGMMVIAYVMGDLNNLKIVGNLKLKENKYQKIFQDFFLIILILAILGQIGAVIYLDFLKGYNFYNQAVYHDYSMPVISLLFMLVQIIFVVILLKWAYDRFLKSKYSSKVTNS